MDPDWITAGVTSIGVPWVLWQYQKDQRWKRSEWVLNEVKHFLNTPLVRNSPLMLDWRSRPIDMLVPGEGRKFFDYEESMLQHGLSAVRFPQQRPYSSEEVYIREAFDELFAGLDRFHCFLDSGLVELEDLRPYLAYWLDVIGNPRNGHKLEATRERIFAYIIDYEFTGVVSLLKRFGHPIAGHFPIVPQQAVPAGGLASLGRH